MYSFLFLRYVRGLLLLVIGDTGQCVLFLVFGEQGKVLGVLLCLLLGLTGFEALDSLLKAVFLLLGVVG